MSTFGKKALLNWNYNSGDTQRYISTNKELQLEILKKWYPVGEFFLYNNRLVKITDYVLNHDSYFISLFNEGIRYLIIPLVLIPTKEFLRDIKLKEILKNV